MYIVFMGVIVYIILFRYEIFYLKLKIKSLLFWCFVHWIQIKRARNSYRFKMQYAFITFFFSLYICIVFESYGFYFYFSICISCRATHISRMTVHFICDRLNWKMCSEKSTTRKYLVVNYELNGIILQQ